MIRRALLVLTLVCVGVGIRAQSPASASGFSGAADTQLLRTASVSLQHESQSQVVQWLRQQPSVLRVRLDGSNRTIDIRFRDGTRGMILPAWRGESSHGTLLNPTVSRPLVRTNAPTPRALVLEPFATELGLGPTAGDPEVNQL